MSVRSSQIIIIIIIMKKLVESRARRQVRLLARAGA